MTTNLLLAVYWFSLFTVWESGAWKLQLKDKNKHFVFSLSRKDMYRSTPLTSFEQKLSPHLIHEWEESCGEGDEECKKKEKGFHSSSSAHLLHIIALQLRLLLVRKRKDSVLTHAIRLLVMTPVLGSPSHRSMATRGCAHCDPYVRSVTTVASR